MSDNPDPFHQNIDDSLEDPLPNPQEFSLYSQHNNQNFMTSPFPLNAPQMYASSPQYVVMQPQAPQNFQAGMSQNQLIMLLNQSNQRSSTPLISTAPIQAPSPQPFFTNQYNPLSYVPSPSPTPTFMVSQDQLLALQMQHHQQQQQQLQQQQHLQAQTASFVVQSKEEYSRKRSYANMQSSSFHQHQVADSQHPDTVFVVKQKCFKTTYGCIVEPKSTIQILVNKSNIMITQVVCKTSVKESPKDGSKKKAKSKPLNQKDYSLTMVFECEDDASEPKAKKYKKAQDSEKTLVFRFKPRDKPIIEEKVAKNVDNVITLKQQVLSSIELIEVPHMLTACLAATIEVEIHYKYSEAGTIQVFHASELENETYIFLSRVPDIAQVQKYFASLLKSHGSLPLESVQQWLLDIVRRTYKPDLTEKEAKYLLNDLTLKEREQIIQFASNIYQFQQCLQYNSKFGTSALKFMWENKYANLNIR